MKHIYIKRVICTLVLTLIFGCFILGIDTVYSGDQYGEFLDLYVEIAKLAQQGIDVSNLVEKLREAHEALTNTRVANLSIIKYEINNVKNEVSRTVLYKGIMKWSSVLGLMSIPILIYLFLPRVYLYLWYKSRRRWVVKTESPR